MDILPQTGIFSLLAHATLTVKFVLALLVAMSLGSWAIIIYKIAVLVKARKQAVADLGMFRATEPLGDAMRRLSRRAESPVYKVGARAMNEIRRLEAAGLLKARHTPVVMQNLDRALSEGVNSQLENLSRSLSFLATCGNSAPFIGLFGTVWGIMHSFHTIGKMKSAALAAVAPGISEALVATAVGLAVAIPATIAFNSFSGMIGTIETELKNFSAEFMNSVQRELPVNEDLGE
jgi:biopolymer transport protein TolQ